MNCNTKLEIAVEIMASKIAFEIRNSSSIKNEKIKELLNEREEMYKENEKILDKIINDYGKEIKSNIEGE